ncbi:MAG: biotin--[acetyl-CoA-carboxylase] ligase, partial [Flavobacteriaceae bacterium]|nr:biotin--[acetyl-CoA-carboxylase] ligase [Flavobacteriaceae bacterium]
MNIIKLNAIDSTNEFLKRLKREAPLVDFTIVTAEFQTKGKGQMGTVWDSESAKNLMVSILKKFDGIDIHQQFYISMATSLAVYKTLKQFISDKLSIKWPNDILSDGYKIAGILIENTVNGHQITDSIIGIGINVNQVLFSSEIKNVSSLQMLLKAEVDRDLVLELLLFNLEKELSKVVQGDFDTMKNEYESLLYKKGIPAMFEDSRNLKFVGMIKNVSESGQLIVEIEDQVLKSFNLKEIK